jgi:hypothetical protein
VNFTELLEIVGNEPVFETGLLLAGNVDPADDWERIVADVRPFLESPGEADLLTQENLFLLMGRG